MNAPIQEVSPEGNSLPKFNRDTARRTNKSPISSELRTALEKTQSNDDCTGYVSERHNSSGSHVKFWQEQINSDRVSRGLLPIPETGSIDKATTEAIKEMQRSLGVAADGIIGPRTFRAFAIRYQGGSDSSDGIFFRDFQIKLLSQEEYETMLVESARRRLSSFQGVDLSGLLDLSGDAVFEKLIPMIFRVEGWYSNDPEDRGGITLAGITWEAYQSYMKEKGVVLSQAESESQLTSYSRQSKDVFTKIASDIYKQNYWIPSGAEKLPPLIAAVHFDAAVNHGVGGASNLLSRTLSDAKISIGDLGNLSEERQQEIAKSYIKHREEYYNSIIANRPSQEKFRNGWMNRLQIVSNCLSSVHGLGIQGTPITLSERNVDMTSLIHTAGTENSRRLAHEMISRVSRTTSTGFCARYVRYSSEAIGLNPHKIGSHPGEAKGYAEVYANSPKYAEITTNGRALTMSEAEQLKGTPGIVFIYDNPSSPETKAGHICVSTPKGPISDFVQQNVDVYEGGGSNQTVRAFIPL